MTDYGSGFESAEVGHWWRYIDSSLGRLVDCLAGLTPEELNWRPPAPGANRLYVLATHTSGNAEENPLAVLVADQQRVTAGPSSLLRAARQTQ